MPGSTVEITGETGSDPRSYRVSFAKVREHLPAFRPRWDAAAGATQLYERFTELGLDDDAYRSRFKRLPVLRGLQESGQLDDSLRWRV